MAEIKKKIKKRITFEDSRGLTRDKILKISKLLKEAPPAWLSVRDQIEIDKRQGITGVIRLAVDELYNELFEL